jgi:hypothetical protein
VQETVEFTYKPIATIEQTHVEFSIHADTETYMDTNLQFYVCGNLTTSDGKDLNAEDFYRQCRVWKNSETYAIHYFEEYRNSRLRGFNPVQFPPLRPD